MNLFCSVGVSSSCTVDSRRAVAIGKLLSSDLIEKEHGGGDPQSSALTMVREHHTAWMKEEDWRKSEAHDRATSMGLSE